MTIIVAAGWILAAFLIGYMAGRSGEAPERRKSKTANKTEITASEAAKEEKAVREWRNFLTYDGTEQSGPVE